MYWEPDYMVSLSPGWNFVPFTGLKYCLGYMLNFSPGAKRKFPWESLLRCENTVDAHARVPFSARDENNDSDYMDFLARLAELKFKPGMKFSRLSGLEIYPQKIRFTSWRNQMERIDFPTCDQNATSNQVPCIIFFGVWAVTKWFSFPRQYFTFSSLLPL